MFKDVIQSLVQANIMVLMYVAYYAEEPWYEIFEKKNQSIYDQRIQPLMQKIIDLNMDGIVLDISNLYVSIELVKLKNISNVLNGIIVW